MKTIIAIALSVALPLVGLGGVATAQSAVEIHGTIDAVDCYNQTVEVHTADGEQTFAAASDAYTDVDATQLPFCSLQGYIGAPATVWLEANGDQFVATTVDVTGPVAVVPAVGVVPVPIWGAVLGTVVVTGLLYLVVHGPDSGYYLYPYYGAYYHHYYHPWYRHYAGFYPASAAIITVALPIVGVVLGTVTVSDEVFLVSRDSGGHYYRYPYYGPYHQYYYRPSYRAYSTVNTQVYVHAAVRQGNAHWDAPAQAMAKVYHGAPGHNVPQRQPENVTHRQVGTTPHQPQPMFHQSTNAPSHQPQPAFHQPTNTSPHQPQPTNAPRHQQQPAFHQPTSTSSHQPQPTNAPRHQQQPASRQPTNTPSYQQQPAFHQPTNTPPHQPQPTNAPRHQQQPAFHQPTDTSPHQPQPTNAPRHQQQPAFQQPPNVPSQPAFRQGGNSRGSQPSSHQSGGGSPQRANNQQCGNPQTDQSCSKHGK